MLPMNIKYLMRLITEYGNSTVNGNKRIEKTTPITAISEIEYILQEIGVPENLKGFLFLREAIYIVFLHDDLIQKITTVLYPEIAKKFHSTPARVERSMRNAIDVTWSRGNFDVIQRIFTLTANKTKPSNSEFIKLIADQLRSKYLK